jgi:NifU-like protein involved in Fe-S cluster formation
MKYGDLLLTHFYSPQNVGVLLENEQGVGRAIVGSYDNGAVIQLHIKVVNNIIVSAKFKAYGNCAIIACCSYLTQWIQGKPLFEATALTSHDLVTALAIPELKINCALLAEDALKLAISDCKNVAR